MSSAMFKAKQQLVVSIIFNHFHHSMSQLEKPKRKRKKKANETFFISEQTKNKDNQPKRSKAVDPNETGLKYNRT